MHKKFIKIILSVWLSALVIMPQIVFGAEIKEFNLDESSNPATKKLEQIGVTSGPYTSQKQFGISNIVGTVVEAALALIGVIFLILMLYAGYNWMTARGEEEKVTKAKDTITRAIIGLIIVVGAYAIWAFIFKALF